MDCGIHIRFLRRILQDTKKCFSHYHMAVDRWQKFEAECIGKNFSLNSFASIILPYGKLYIDLRHIVRILCKVSQDCTNLRKGRTEYDGFLTVHGDQAKTLLVNCKHYHM